MTTVFFQNIESALISNIKKAEQSLKIAVAWFLNPHLFQLIRTHVSDGRAVEIILCDDIVNFNHKSFSFQDLIDKNVAIRISRHPNLMHHKFCIIDDRLLLTGSYNWTIGAEKNNYENLIISNDLLLVNQFVKEFEQLKLSTELVKFIATEIFHEYGFVKSEDDIDSFEIIKTEKLPVWDNANNEELEGIANVNRQLFEKADKLYRNLKHQQAIEICKRIIESQPDIPEVYELIGAAKWRQKKYKDMIKYAAKVIELDNRFMAAYNLIAIGYGHVNNSQKALENYRICIDDQPEDYGLYRNRGLTYLSLSEEPSLPKKFRDNFLNKARQDFLKVIALTDELISDISDYHPVVCRSIAFFHLGKYYDAKRLFEITLNAYYRTPKDIRDSHDLQDIKMYQKDLKQLLNS